MGRRGEVYSTRIFTDEGRKTFFFNVKENRYRDSYLNIVESRKTDNGFKRSSLIVFDDDLEKFLTAFESSKGALAKRGESADIKISVGGGRREYLFRALLRGKRTSLQITEKREDATGSRRQSLVVSSGFLEIFSDSMKKAVSAMRNADS